MEKHKLNIQKLVEFIQTTPLLNVTWKWGEKDVVYSSIYTSSSSRILVFADRRFSMTTRTTSCGYGEPRYNYEFGVDAPLLPPAQPDLFNTERAVSYGETSNLTSFSTHQLTKPDLDALVALVNDKYDTFVSEREQKRLDLSLSDHYAELFVM